MTERQTARVRFAHSQHVTDEVRAEWGQVQRALCRWTLEGCAHVESDGSVLDLVTLATVSPEELGGAELVIFHSHLTRQYPWLLRPACGRPSRARGRREGH